MIGTELVSLKFIPKENNGWQSDELSFGKAITFLKGENGSGKTPLLLGIVYCLGYPSEFRSDILAHCLAIQLKIKVSGKSYLISRSLDKKNWTVTDLALNEEIVFTNENIFADWYFETCSVPRQVLTNSDEQNPAEVYLSTYLPSFYIDQNHGWQVLYYPPKKFIKDQYQEMLRLVFGVSPKNPHKKKDALIQEKIGLSRLQEVIEDREFVLKELEKAIGDNSDESLQELQDKKVKLKARLEQLQESTSYLSRKTTSFDTRISDLQVEISKTSDSRNNLRLRISAFDSIKAEISSEVETLSLNVEAAESFRKFCSSKSETCKLFCASDEAYGKSLLYLKDQMKDLESNKEKMVKALNDVDINISEKEKEIQLEKIKIDDVLKSSGNETFLNSMKEVAHNLVDIETRIAFKVKLNDQKSKYSVLLAKRSESQKKIQELQLNSKSSGDSLLAEVRSNLASSLEKWLKILNTPNVKGPYRFDERLALTIGDDKLSVFRGSTLTRIVLAYHASVIEVAIAMGGANHLGFCILDTPMQQELKVKDLQVYITALRDLLSKNPNKIQICLSFSDADIVPCDDDAVWEPNYFDAVNNKKYYLKT